MKILNYTPHVINYHAPDGSVVAFAPTGLARVDVVTEEDPDRYGIENAAAADGSMPVARLVRSQYRDVQGLPAQEFGVYLLVSRLVKSACPDRADLLVPAALVRDDAGRVVGCQAFER